MATPSGTIGLSDVNIELGFAGTTLITMNQANVRTLAGVGGSGTPISMQNLQNKSNRVTASATISSDTANYVLNTAKAPGYSVGKTDMTLTINPSINVYSSSTGSYALTVDTSWTTGDTVTVVNNGVIVGRGGNGGNGSFTISGGSSGGPALLVQRAITMNNLSRIAGGGGGGGGGGDGAGPEGKGAGTTGGGGGGGGIGGSSGGGGGSGSVGSGSPGSSGTLTSAGGGGGGGGGSYASAGPGGPGGGYGSNGSSGSPSAYRAGAGGGSAGACIVGNGNITYTNTGTRNGSIS